jgi:hypothetical protein
MKTRSAILATALALCAASANALLVRTSDTTTLDATSGLEWLNLNETTGPSFAQVRDGFVPGGAYAGWRFAFGAEVQQVFSDPQIGLPITFYGTWGPELGPAVQRFGDFFGLNVGDGFIGLIADPIPDFPGFHPIYAGGSNGVILTNFDPCPSNGGGRLLLGGGYAFEDRLYIGNCTEIIVTGFREDFASDRSFSTGSFLVRPYVAPPPGSGGPIAAIPEPESWAMMLGGLALMGLGWVGRRK